MGQLRTLLENETGLMRIRNIGQKSMTEIKRVFFEECYARLQPCKKAHYLQEVLDAQVKM